MTPTEKVFNDFNVKRDDTETTDALQLAITKLMDEGEPISFPGGSSYRVSDTIHFSSSEPKFRTRIEGYGAVINSRIPDQPWTVDAEQDGYEETQDIEAAEYKPVFFFNREPHEWHVTCQGLTINAHSAVGVIGLETAGTTQSTFREIDLESTWVGIRAEGWNCIYEKLNVGSPYLGLWLYSGSRGLNSNVNEVRNCRVRGAKSGWNDHSIKPYANYLIEGGGNKLTSCTAEGSLMRYVCMIDTSRNAAYRASIGHLHQEGQEWQGVSHEEARTIGIVEQRHDIFLGAMDAPASLRYGLRSLKPGVGNLTWFAGSISDKENHLPRAWEGVDRVVDIYGQGGQGSWHGQESYEKWREAIDIKQLRMIVDGEKYN